MKALFAVLLSVLPMKSQPLDYDRMIRVLIAIEGGKWNSNSSPGGAARISYSAWSDRTKHAYQLAMNLTYGMTVYRLHLAWIERTLLADGFNPTVNNVAVVWRRGYAKAKEIGFADEYGDRAENLYTDRSF